MSRCISMLLALLLCGAASPPAGEAETITIRRIVYLCGGLCPEYEITVHRNGLVLGDRIEWIQVTAEEAVGFHALLAPFRRSRSQADCIGSPVRRTLLPPEVPASVIEITWAGPGEARLRVCRGAEYRRLADVIDIALLAIHFGPLGYPLRGSWSAH
jgi:hypothetical protein